VMDITERALERPGPFTHYHRVVLPGGSVRILHNRGAVRVGDDGRPVRMFGTEQDVTERRQAEVQLERSNEQLRSLSVRLQAAREEESIRIAREIHDEMGGALTALKMDLSWISKRLSEQSRGAVQQKLQSALELIDETVVKVRNISTELRPSVLDDLGLAAAVEWQAREFEKRTEIRCEIVSLYEDITFGPEKSTAVFRIFQEILTNVSRHAHASRVEVRMTGHGGDLLLTVSDNGRGIDEGKVADATSIGLLGMRERALIFGGQVDVVGAEGRGTTVTVRIPLG
jgi:signal transduction histidine kinase